MSTMRVAATFGTRATEARIAPYERALCDAGMEPVRNPKSLHSLHGLLLSGGSDINPVHYGQTRIRESDTPDDERDVLELRLLQEALDADLPVFAICRGLQVLNVALHGTLVQDLDSKDVHRQKPGNAEAGKHPSAHRVWVAPETRLAKIVGAGGLDVNSRHHQAIENLGKGLAVSAISEDGVIEGIEKPGAAFVVAVQWHPEDRVLVSAADRKLFEAFAAAIASSLAGHRAAPRPSS
jgi:putative glutamine amidotransferase